ncbi:MAG: hypothetical protein GX160_09415, partial [Clostridiales bacterium]|nr:hypothetical protein [Clostridiales bacterium]
MLYTFTGYSSIIYAEDYAPTYNYSYWGDAVASPAPYNVETIIDGKLLGVGSLREPNDIFVVNDEQVYIVDSGNNRIVVTDSNFELINIIDSFNNNGERDGFSNPQGIFVTDQGDIYVADTGNQRVVHLDQNINLVKIVDSPESELLSDKFEFQPSKLVVDNAGRIYVMALGVFDGFMEFSADGMFTTFIGANKVQVDPIEYIWKLLSTRQQRAALVQFVPTEFANLDIDEDGFIYAVTTGQTDEDVKRLNAQGIDILRRDGYISPVGDIIYYYEDGPSKLMDVTVADCEVYSVLDGKRGRIFTYNGDGYLLYVFGGIGNRLGEFHTPIAIDRIGDNFLVLDKILGEITIFKPTEYGKTINEAIRSYYNGEQEKASAMFDKAVKLNANLELAYGGIGKSLIRSEDYEEAVKYFKESNDRKQYSKAYVLYRREKLRKIFPLVMTIICLLALCYPLLKKYVFSRIKKISLFNKEVIRYPLRLIFHPYDEYWELKYRRDMKTNLIIAFIILALLCLTRMLQDQYNGFLVNYNNPKEFNSLMKIVYVIVPVLFWSIANWSLTTLIDGEGKFSEIFVST